MNILWGWLFALIWFFPVYLTLLQYLFLKCSEQTENGWRMNENIPRKERLIMFGWAILWFIWIPLNWSAIVGFWKNEFAKDRARKNGTNSGL